MVWERSCSYVKLLSFLVYDLKWEEYMSCTCDAKYSPNPLLLCRRNKANIYFYSSLTDDWRCDQYRWANQGVRRLPKREPQVKKSYFHIDTPKGPSSNFVKHAYQLVAPSNTSTVLIHYIGDEKEVVDFPHGNASNQSGRPHIRTCPSVLKSLQDAFKHTTTAKAYKSHVTKVPPPTL